MPPAGKDKDPTVAVVDDTSDPATPPVEVKQSQVDQAAGEPEQNTDPAPKGKQAKLVTLVVKTNFIDNFVYHTSDGDEPYVVTRTGTDVPEDLAGTLIDSALASGVLVTTKD